MKIWFTKMTGAGNDFVVIDNRPKRIRDGSKAAKVLCDRRQGIGADGLLLLEKSRRADYRMMYYNADGSYGGMCGNGGRCIARYAALNGIAPRRHDFEALDYIYKAEVRKSEVVLAMKDARDLTIGLKIDVGSLNIVVNFVDTGSPHVVVPVKNLGRRASPLASVDVVGLGRAIRNHKRFAPVGTNVNFIEKGRGNSIQIRTYERGVEDETLGCGTGAIASAIVASRMWKLRPPIRVLPKSRMQLRVGFKDTGARIEKVRLAGPASVVYAGLIDFSHVRNNSLSRG